MTKLDAMLPGMYAQLHADGAFKGGAWKAKAGDGFVRFLKEHKAYDGLILDFGCGPEGGLKAHPAIGHRVIPHDPYVLSYAAKPSPDTAIRVLFSCDVLEHLSLDALGRFADQVRDMRNYLEYAYISVATRSANKLLPNGLNVHLTVWTPQRWHGWFEGNLGDLFEVVLAEADLLADTAVFGLRRRTT